MNLKTRIALNLSIAFSIIMGIVMTVIYIFFANFRKAEFKENLEHSAVVTANYISKLPQKVLNNDDKTVDDINNDEDDFLINTVFSSNIKEIGGRVLPTVMKLVPADQPKNSTILEYEQLEFGVNFKPDFFSVKNMKVIR